MSATALAALAWVTFFAGFASALSILVDGFVRPQPVSPSRRRCVSRSRASRWTSSGIEPGGT
jgi:hypothetical protein